MFQMYISRFVLLTCSYMQNTNCFFATENDCELIARLPFHIFLIDLYGGFIHLAVTKVSIIHVFFVGFGGQLDSMFLK